MKAEQLTSLSRVVDPRYPSNRLMLAGAGFAGLGVGATALLGADLKAGALAAAASVFLAWAVARELDPDHPASAAIAMPVALATALLVGPPALLVTFGVLLGVRITAGTVGTPLRPLDFIAVVGLSGALGTNPIGAVGAAAMIAGVLVAEGRSGRGIATAAMSAIAYAVVALLSDLDLAWVTPTPTEWITVGLAVVATVLVVPAATPTSGTDRHTGTVSRNRVTAARLIAVLTILFALTLTGATGIAALAATIAAAIIGTSIHRIADRPR